MFEKVNEAAYDNFFDKSKLSDLSQTGVNLGCGLLSGFAAALVSQPADTMLSVINKTQGAPGEGTVSRLFKIAGELGIRGSYAGISTRLFMVGGLTAGQFAIYGDIKVSRAHVSHYKSMADIFDRKLLAPPVVRKSRNRCRADRTVKVGIG